MDASTPITKTALTNSAVLIQTGEVKLGALAFNNPGAATSYVQLFDVAAANAVTLGTTVPNAVIGLAAGATISGPQDLGFWKGLVAACTSTPTGAGAPNAAAVCTFGVRTEF